MIFGFTSMMTQEGMRLRDALVTLKKEIRSSRLGKTNQKLDFLLAKLLTDPLYKHIILITWCKWRSITVDRVSLDTYVSRWK